MSQNAINPTVSAQSTPAIDEPNITNNDDAIATNFSGATDPTVSFNNQLWTSTDSNILYNRNNANSTWNLVKNISSTSNNIVTSNKMFAEVDNGKTFFIKNDGATTINLIAPQNSSVSPGWSVGFIILNDNLVNLISLASTYPITGQNNVKYNLSLSREDGRIVLTGVENGLDPSLSDISDKGKKVIQDLINPIGTALESHTHITPPMQGVLGISWELLSTNYAIRTTAIGKGAGSLLGDSSLVSDSRVKEHALSKDEIPLHRHASGIGGLPGQFYPWGSSGGALSPIVRGSLDRGDSTLTNFVGSSTPHDHTVNINWIRLEYWIRTS
tara:strand:+ start:10701 stop:11684 length:984 start_codon:yes stop_codon:yes gene_type:complete